MSDEGFMLKNGAKFVVESAEIKGGYVCHIGKVVEGSYKVGDVVDFNFDTMKRRLMMSNHTATHILNFGLRKVLGEDSANQRGSLVAPDRLRFDFTNKSAMTADQVKKVEDITNEVVSMKKNIYAKEASLAVAKTITGLRAVFGEVYPDPVRVISVGIPVEDLEKDPQNPEGNNTSIEFCGGTHLHNSGHIEKFVIVSEEAIAKGIRRIVALTGVKATTAMKKGTELETKVAKLKSTVESKACSYKDNVRQISDVMDLVNAAVIQYWKKEQLRKAIEAVKKTLADEDRARKATIAKEALIVVKKVISENMDVPYIVLEVDAFAQNKVLNDALKEVKNGPPTLFISPDEDNGKILAMATVPKNTVKSTGLGADQWVKSLADILNGKGGGKAENAQLSGTNVGGLASAITIAEEHVMKKLACEKVNLKGNTVVKNVAKEAKNVAKEVKNVAKKSGKDTNKPSGQKLVLETDGTQGLDRLPFLAAKFSGCEIDIVEKNKTKTGVIDANGAPVAVGHLPAALFVSSETLKPEDPITYAQVLSWMMYAANDLHPLVVNCQTSKRKGAGDKHLLPQVRRLNQALASRTFLVSERMTTADLALYVVLAPWSMNEDSSEELPYLQRWKSLIGGRIEMLKL